MLQILDMATYLFPFFVDDDVYEGGLVVGENTAQPVDQRFSAYRYERFGVYYPFDPSPAAMMAYSISFILGFGGFAKV